MKKLTRTYIEGLIEDARNSAREKEETMKTYTISAGQYDSLLNTRGERTGHATVDAAMRALADATPYDASDLVRVEGGAGDEWYVYASHEAADRDADGSRALAVIERAE